MSPTAPHTSATLQADNVPPPFVGIDLFSSDRALVEAVAREAPGLDPARLRDFGRRMGAAETWDIADLVHRHPPQLHAADRYGRPIDEVEFHPSWHQAMAIALNAGTAAAPWRGEPHGQTLHAALEYLLAQVEPSVCCPVTMTYAAPAALKHAPDIARDWVPKIAAAGYDAGDRPAASKSAVTIGMAMTEKQGGSDLRANTTRAEPVGDGWYVLNGQKWFCSAPMSDAFLTLAQTAAGLTCFLVPRFRRDGAHNGMHIVRLKNKIGDRGNASSEIAYDGAEAVRIGEEGRGIRTLLDMVHHTRLDCAIAPAAYMRTGIAQALWHTAHRSAFGKSLIDQALMQRVLADLIVEAEAATITAFRLARSFDDADHDAAAQLFSRVATPIAKYWLNKRVTGHIAECMECHGGNGYIEDWPIARFYLQAPLNGIWEGSGNIICLDVLRALSRYPEAADILTSEIERARGANSLFDRALQQHLPALRQPHEASARHVVECVAVLLQASLMLRHAPAADADLFCAARLEGRHGSYGAFGGAADVGAIIRRAMPGPG